MRKHPVGGEDQIVRRLRLRDLRYLQAICDQGSMAKAAKLLGVSQPAISRAMADLEATIGVPLFDRSPQGVVPTRYAEALLERGRTVTDELKQGVNEILSLADPAAGEVRIGCAESIAVAFVPAIIDAFLERHPRVNIVVNQTIVVPPDYHELEERQLDLMIGRIVRPLNREIFQTEILFQERIFVIASATSPWARRRKITLADLRNARWVRAPVESPIGGLHSEAFAAAGSEFRPPTVATYSQHLVLELVAKGGYVATVPGVMLALCKSRGIRVLPIDLAVERRPLAIVTLRRRMSIPVVQRFIESIRAAARTINVEP